MNDVVILPPGTSPVRPPFSASTVGPIMKKAQEKPEQRVLQALAPGLATCKIICVNELRNAAENGKLKE